MKFRDIIKEWLEENLLLFKDSEKFRSVTIVRVISLLAISITSVVIYQLCTGILSFDMGFVVGIFAIFVSWLFFWSSQRSQTRQEENLLAFMRDLKAESMRSLERIHEKLESPPAFRSGAPPTPSDQDTCELTDKQAEELSKQMEPKAKQIFLAMAEVDRPIEVNQPMYYRYDHGEKDLGAGAMLMSYLVLQLNEAELVKYKGAARDFVTLTSRGKAFARWLCKNGQKADYFESPQLGKWGEPTERAKKRFDEEFPEWEIYKKPEVAERIKREVSMYSPRPNP
jgi:hypothetical protein